MWACMCACVRMCMRVCECMHTCMHMCVCTWYYFHQTLGGCWSLAGVPNAISLGITEFGAGITAAVR